MAETKSRRVMGSTTVSMERGFLGYMSSSKHSRGEESYTELGLLVIGRRLGKGKLDSFKLRERHLMNLTQIQPRCALALLGINLPPTKT
jgi:hypothetical protein